MRTAIARLLFKLLEPQIKPLLKQLVAEQAGQFEERVKAEVAAQLAKLNLPAPVTEEATNLKPAQKLKSADEAVKGVQKLIDLADKKGATIGNYVAAALVFLSSDAVSKWLPGWHFPALLSLLGLASATLMGGVLWSRIWGYDQYKAGNLITELDKPIKDQIAKADALLAKLDRTVLRKHWGVCVTLSILGLAAVFLVASTLHWV